MNNCRNERLVQSLFFGLTVARRAATPNTLMIRLNMMIQFVGKFVWNTTLHRSEGLIVVLWIHRFRNEGRCDLILCCRHS